VLTHAGGTRRDSDDGFTLIELLVVIIIIGILAAIAIPVFLNQRQKGYDAAIKSDLRNAATAEETYLTDFGVYTTSQASLVTEGFKPSGTSNYSGGTATLTTVYETTADVRTTTVNTQGYCISATAASGSVWSYDSAAGGLRSKGAACP
jgi:type IV pilus assembly protein PilA